MQYYKLFYLLFFLSCFSFSQNLFDKTLEGCNTERFKIESKRVTAIIAEAELEQFISQITSEDIRKKIRGVLKLQFVVYTDGTTCFLSYENDTNIDTDDLNIEEFKSDVDANLVWENGVENVTALVEVTYKKKHIKMTRYGINRSSGYHKLKN